MNRYLVTTHAHLDGARLSKLGHWGNVHHGSVAEAEDAARKDAGTVPHRIAHQRFPGLPAPIGRHPAE